MSNFSRVKIIVLAIFLCCLLFVIRFFCNLDNELSKIEIKSLNTDPEHYFELFNSKAKQKLVLNTTLSLKFRNAISLFNYDQKYSIQVTKINTVKNFEIKKDIIALNTNTQGVNGVFVPFYEKNFLANYKSISMEKASKIYLILEGDTIKTIKNDSVAFYNLNVGKLAVQFKLTGNELNEIHYESVSGNAALNLLFLKRNGKLFFLTLSSKEANAKIDPDLLLKLINN